MATKIIKQQDYEAGVELEQQLAKAPQVAGSFLAEDRGVISREGFEAATLAKKVIVEAEREALHLRHEAQRLYQRVEEKMRAEKERGFQEGRQEGLAQASEMILAAKRVKEQMFQDCEPNLIKLVFEIVEKILGREIQTGSGGPIDLIKQVLQAALGQDITVLVNPEDCTQLKARQQELVQVLEGSKVLRLKEDDKVKPGGCIVESEIGTIDAQLETQLEAIKKAFDLT